MIAKNEEANIQRCLDSVSKHVDEIIVVDTGSSDKTKEIALACGAQVFDCNPITHPQFFFMDDASTGAPPPYSNEQCLGNFAGARNFSFEKATKDYVLWLDCDDVLENAHLLRATVERLAQYNLDVAWFAYNYASDDKGRVVCHLWRERIIRRGIAAKWTNPIHEVLVPLSPEKSLRVQEIVVQHMRPAERTALVAHRNYKVLLPHLKANPGDARTLFYFGNEARGVDINQAFGTYEQYVELSGWNEERAIARIYLGDLCYNSNQLGKAYAHFAASTIDLPHFPDGYYGLAKIAYHKGDFVECVRLCEEGLKRGAPESVIMINPMTRSYLPHTYYNVALFRLGRVEEAIASCAKGLAIAPEDGNLLNNINFYRQYLWEQTDPVRIALNSDRVHTRVKESIMRALGDMANPPPVRKLPPPAEGKLSIVLWCGPAVEWWNPNSPKTTGIGGSETAAIEMCKNLAARGHQVTVYSECPNMDDIYDGVAYKRWNDFGGVECDVFISSRQPVVMDHEIKAKLKLLWVHDIHCGPSDPAMHTRLLKFDRYLCLSNWHKEYFLNQYKFLHPSTVLVTRNGIDPARFAGEMPPKKNRLVFSSSANRGLDMFLDLFTKIKVCVPDVEGDVCYGFETWERTARAYSSQAELTEIDNYKKRLASTPGVTFHGRVNQDVLARMMMEAKVLAYPTAFTETYCVSALEAQAAGCVPVTTGLAALNETVKHGVLIPGHISEPIYQQAFVYEVVKLLTSEKTRVPLAEAGREYALQLSWEKLAVEWEMMFEKLIVEMSETIVLPYEGMYGKAA